MLLTITTSYLPGEHVLHVSIRKSKAATSRLLWSGTKPWRARATVATRLERWSHSVMNVTRHHLVVSGESKLNLSSNVYKQLEARVFITG